MENLIAALRAFRDERDWAKFHTPKDLAVSISIESAELLEHFQWRAEGHDLSKLDRQGIAKEAADVLLYTLMLFDRLGLDPVQEAIDKIQANAERYPAGDFYGSPDSLAARRDGGR